MKVLNTQEVHAVSGGLLPLLFPMISTWVISFGIYSLAVLYKDGEIATPVDYITH